MDNQKSILFVGYPDENLASYRFRILKAMHLLYGPDYVCHQERPENFMKYATTQPYKGFDFYFMHKHSNSAIELVCASHIKNLTQGKLIYDICDDHFDRTHGHHYKLMSKFADVITTTNERFAKRIEDITGKKPLICYDPINTEAGDFKPLTAKPRVVWFGHATNFNYFISMIGGWYKGDITVYCNIQSVNDGVMVHFDDAPHINFEINQFKVGRVEKELKDYDVAIIPQNDELNETKFKSPNRVVDALNAGLAVITNSEEVYGEFRPFIFINKNLEHAYEDYLKCDKKALALKIKHGQQYIRENYSDGRIKEQWQRAFSN